MIELSNEEVGKNLLEPSSAGLPARERRERDTADLLQTLRTSPHVGDRDETFLERFNRSLSRMGWSGPMGQASSTAQMTADTAKDVAQQYANANLKG
jgi:hypothetical protein